jgi:predicted lipoprotein with Yx(FWY)xxD motif
VYTVAELITDTAAKCVCTQRCTNAALLWCPNVCTTVVAMLAAAGDHTDTARHDGPAQYQASSSRLYISTVQDRSQQQES